MNPKGLIKGCVVLFLVLMPFIAFYFGFVYGRSLNDQKIVATREKEKKVNEYEKWIAYKDTKHHFTFKYPPGFIESEEDTSYFPAGDMVSFLRGGYDPFNGSVIALSVPISTALSVDEWTRKEFVANSIFGKDYINVPVRKDYDWIGSPVAKVELCDKTCALFGFKKNDQKIYGLLYFSNVQGQDEQKEIFRKIMNSFYFYDDTEDKWLTYESSAYKYRIDRPESAQTVRSVIRDFHPDAVRTLEPDMPKDFKKAQVYLFNKYTDQICLRINYKGGYIFISAPENREGMVMCYETGTGLNEEPISEEVEIEGVVYNAKGFRAYDLNEDDLKSSKKSSIDYKAEFLVIELKDGTKITIASQENMPYEMYIHSKPILIEIVETYRSI